MFSIFWGEFESKSREVVSKLKALKQSKESSLDSVEVAEKEVEGSEVQNGY